MAYLALYKQKCAVIKLLAKKPRSNYITCWKGDKPLFNRDDVREPYTETFLKNSAGKIRTGTFCRFSRKGKETIYNACAFCRQRGRMFGNS
jgi:hypothetical protein